jgi:hypothetical protein
MSDKRTYEVMSKLRALDGELAFSIDCFGDRIAQREKYKSHRGLDAVHFYLLGKHHWLPSQVRSLSWEDLRFLLEEEMAGWTLPKEAIEAKERGLAQLEAERRPTDGAAQRGTAGAKKPARRGRERVSPLKVD